MLKAVFFLKQSCSVREFTRDSFKGRAKFRISFGASLGTILCLLL
jgi:hypothetical protein